VDHADVSSTTFFSLIIEGDRNKEDNWEALLWIPLCSIVSLRVLAPSYHPLVMTFFQNLTIAGFPPFAARGASSSSFLWPCGMDSAFNHSPGALFRGFKWVTANRARYSVILEPVCAILLEWSFWRGVTYKTVLGAAYPLSGYLTVKDK